MRLVTAVLSLVLPLPVLTACGAQVGGPDEVADGGRWDVQRLDADLGVDQAPILATAGDDAVVLAVSEGAVITSNLSRGGGEFVAGTPLKTDLRFLQLGDVARLSDGDWLALGSGGSVEKDGDEEMTFAPAAFRSADGLMWEQVDVTGFDHPVELAAMEVVGDTIVVAGDYRLARDPGMGGFEAHLWTSTDGTTFTQVDLPGVRPPRGYRRESVVSHLAIAGDRVLAAGRVNRSAAVWASEDAGRTWDRVADPVLADTYDISGLAANGDTVLAGVGEGSVSALRSTDAGRTWSPVKELPVSGEEAGWAPVWAGGGRFWTLTGIDDMSWDRPEVCYADLDQCGASPGPRLVTSTDGHRWTGVELSAEPDAIMGTADGRTLAVLDTSRGLAIYGLQPGLAPPAASDPATPKTIRLVTVAEGEEPEVGVRYHAPLYLHCGMDWLFLGDTSWRRTDGGPDVETGAGDGSPEGWPVVGQALYGYATLTDATHLDYTIGEGEVVASYERAEGAPGCD